MGLKNEFELAMENESSVFELRFYCLRDNIGTTGED